MLDCEQMMKRQQVLADFGEFALHSESLDEVLTEACRLVGEALGTHRAKILEIQEDGQCLFVRAGVGWAPDVVGQMRLPMGERSSETFAIKEGKPVITQDISQEERFEVPEFMKKAGVVALANVPIFVLGKKAYGLLQVDATVPRDFGQEDIGFLRTYATILGPVIDRLQKVGTLRSTEERFRLVVENARNYAIFTSDPEDRITDWYPGAEAVFGWTAEEAIGQPSSIMFTPEDREAGQDARETETACREGSAPNVRWHVRKDGSRVFIEGSVTTLHHSDGSLRGFLKIGQDVTERRTADERLRDAFAIKTVGVIFWGPDFRLIEINDAFLAMSGFSREEALGKTWQELTPEEFHPASLKAVEQLMTLGEATPYEKQYFRKDGSRWWGLFAPRRVGDEAVEFVLDVTDRKRTGEALRESEARFRAVANLVPDFLWSSDPTGRVTWFNERWFAYTGQSDEQAQGYGWLDVLHPEDRERSLADFQALNEGKPFSGEHRIRRADGQYRWFLTRAELTRDEAGRTAQCFGAATDVDDLRQLQDQQAVVVAELQHRTRNLITVVRSIAQQTMAASSSLEVFRTQFNDRLAALSRVQGLLSRAEQEPITIGTLVRSELDALGAGALQERIVLDGPEVRIRKGTVQTFALALHELATNARKYGALSTDQGQLTVTWRVHVPEGEGRHLLLEWVEQGISQTGADSSTRRGYGRELIERALPYVLQAKTSYELGESGLRCSINLPLTVRTKKASP